jgi:hypothetical protein
MLVGIEVGVGKFFDFDVIKSVRAVFRVGDKESVGPLHGTEVARVTRLVAKPGYAVGTMTLKSGANADGVSLKFVRINGVSLAPNDTYESEWVGDPRPGDRTVQGDGRSVVLGICGKANAKDNTGLGLVLKTNGGSQPPPNLKSADPTVQGLIMGGQYDPAFREDAPEGGMLIGLEVGVGPVMNEDSVVSVRALYKTAKGEVQGTQRGPAVPRTTTIKAKEGYAIVQLKGFWSVRGCEGLCAIFMRLTPDGVDATDSYESEWVGRAAAKAKAVRVGAMHKQAVGIIGRVNQQRREVSGVGLLLKP